MVLTLATPPRTQTRIWIQSGKPLPEYDAPGFDESCKYIEYEPNQGFIIMIDSHPAATLDDYIAFFVEIDGEALSYIFISGPGGFKKCCNTFPMRGDFEGGVVTTNRLKDFKFPPRDSLGQILVRVFKMQVLQDVPNSRLKLDVFERKGKTRDVPCYQRVRNWGILTTARLQEGHVFVKPTNEEPLAVFRFKPRTAKQLQQLLSPMPALDFLLDLAPEAERGPQPPSDKVKSAPAVLTTTPNLPKPRQISAIIPPSRQVLLQPYESPLAPPSVPSFGSINNPATGPLPSKQTASLAQKLGQSLAQANDSTPPLAPPSGSMISFPSPVEQWLARLEDYKASRSSSALQGPVFSVQASLGQLGRKLHRTLPWAGTWGAVTAAPPLAATFHNMKPKTAAELEEVKLAAPANTTKRKREEHENNENVTLRERPVKKQFTSTE